MEATWHAMYTCCNQDVNVNALHLSLGSSTFPSSFCMTNCVPDCRLVTIAGTTPGSCGTTADVCDAWVLAGPAGRRRSGDCDAATPRAPSMASNRASIRMVANTSGDGGIDASAPRDVTLAGPGIPRAVMVEWTHLRQGMSPLLVRGSPRA